MIRDNCDEITGTVRRVIATVTYVHFWPWVWGYYLSRFIGRSV